MNRQYLALYGLKYNPFAPDLPLDALHINPAIQDFCWRVENALVREGGFALISGHPGSGKSAVLRLLEGQLSTQRELTVGALVHPTSNLADFYREMGELFGVTLRPHNRWGGFKALRTRWLEHLKKSLLRPVLLIDEAQEMRAPLLSELRLLASTHFDSQIILTIVLAGDQRLTQQLHRDDLLPLASRIRTQLRLEPQPIDQLEACLKHLQTAAGSPNLMTDQLVRTVAERAAGNYRTLTSMANDLLTFATQHNITTLDEQLFLECFEPNSRTQRKAAGR